MDCSKLNDMSLLKEIANLEFVRRMKVTTTHSIKYGGIIGTTSMIGSILGGPIGLAIGGVVSSLALGYAFSGKYNSVSYILLNETTPEQKKKLLEEVHSFLKLKHLNTVQQIFCTEFNSKFLIESLIQIIIMFLSSEMGINVKTEYNY